MTVIQMNLRKAKITDLKAIISWIPDKPTCKRWAGPKVRFPLSIESLSKDIGFSANNSYCLIKTEAIIAFGQLLTKENGYLHLARIIVDPSKRAMGYGRLLCNELLQIAIHRGCYKISLNVYRNNTSALKLDEKLGFREIAEKSSKENCHMIMGPQCLCIHRLQQ
ncbi:MAG: GNAT family N-acetyltransferase [Desulfobacterales bacterium]|jgi:ribosomal protein S18 acetylase RimI-like enzyme